MYLHVGKGKTLKKENIIGIFDLDTATISHISKNFINKKEKEGLVEYDDTDLPRSFVVYKKGEEEKIILSRISTLGLRERAEELINE